MGRAIPNCFLYRNILTQEKQIVKAKKSSANWEKAPKLPLFSPLLRPLPRKNGLPPPQPAFCLHFQSRGCNGNLPILAVKQRRFAHFFIKIQRCVNFIYLYGWKKQMCCFDKRKSANIVILHKKSRKISTHQQNAQFFAFRIFYSVFGTFPRLFKKSTPCRCRG